VTVEVAIGAPHGRTTRLDRLVQQSMDILVQWLYLDGEPIHTPKPAIWSVGVGKHTKGVGLHSSALHMHSAYESLGE
jgi:hypothetical protein